MSEESIPDKIVAGKVPDGKIDLQAAAPSGRISNVFGMFKRDGARLLSIEEINRIIEEGWALRQ
jgi:hypothetical protein